MSTNLTTPGRAAAVAKAERVCEVLSRVWLAPPSARPDDYAAGPFVPDSEVGMMEFRRRRHRGVDRRTDAS